MIEPNQQQEDECDSRRLQQRIAIIGSGPAVDFAVTETDQRFQNDTCQRHRSDLRENAARKSVVTIE